MEVHYKVLRILMLHSANVNIAKYYFYCKLINLNMHFKFMVCHCSQFKKTKATLIFSNVWHVFLSLCPRETENYSFESEAENVWERLLYDTKLMTCILSVQPL